MEQPSLFKGIPPIVKKKKKDDYMLGPKTDPAKHDYSYSKYIQSYEWRKKAKRAKELLGNKCRECGDTENLEVHHIHYSNLYNESIFDVIIVCDICHKPADRRREIQTGFSTWLCSRYGENAYLYADDEREWDDFIDWISREEEY